MTDVPEVCRCEKKQYASRKSAKIAAKKAFPGQHLSAYPCGNGFHIGHLPSRVIAGDKDRADIVREPKPKVEYEPRAGVSRSNLSAMRNRRGGKRKPVVVDFEDYDDGDDE